MLLRKKEVNQVLKKEEDKVNHALLNIIAPSAVDVDRSHLNISENIGRVFCISKYDSSVDYGWLSSISNLEGTMTTIEFRYTVPDKIVPALNKKISELKENRDLAKKESEKQTLEDSIENIKKLINRIAVKGEPVGFINILLYITAEDEERLAARIRRIQSIISLHGCSIRPLVYRQLLAFKAIAPYGLPNKDDVSNVGERPMPISTFIGGFPSASTALFDENGFYLGKTKDSRLVILNQWLRGRDRTNSNWFITGVPGVGKSTAIKRIILPEYWLGSKVIIFDPEKEYVDITRNENVAGNVIDCNDGAKGRINPLQVRATCKLTEDDIEAGENKNEYLLFEDDENGSELALFLQQLRLFFSLYFGKENYNTEIKTVLERCLIALYKKFNITWETDIRSIPNDGFPIMSDLYDYVKEEAGKETDTYYKSILNKLILLLEPAAYGADQFLWNGYTTLSPKSSFIDLDVSSLLEVDDNVKRAQFCNLTTWAWAEMSKDRKEKVIFVVDEGHLFVDPDYPDILKYLKNIAKRGRKYECGLMFITHSVVDVLDPSVKRYGQAIIDTACYKLLMGCDGKNLEETVKLFNLSEKETSILAALTRGQGILFCGKKRININIDISEEMLDILGDAGGR